MVKQKTKPDLSLGDFLIAEYEFIANTFLQGDNIPNSVLNFDMTAFIGVIIAILSNKLQFDTSAILLVNITFTIFFMWLSFRGVTTVIQLARLRSAWYESFLAMNRIKDFYISHFPESHDAFRWQTKTMPRKFNRSSISFILVLQVAFLSSLAYGVSIYLILTLIGINNNIWAYTISGLLGLISFLVHLALYRRLLSR